MFPRSARICCLLAVLAPVARNTPQAAASEPAPEMCVLLHNGNLLSGIVKKDADHCEVARGGAVLRVAKEEVDLIAASPVDAYEQQRRRLKRPTAAQHLKLAEWCLRYDLHPQAARELLDARGLDAAHPQLEIVARRLSFAEAARAPTGSEASRSAPSDAVVAMAADDDAEVPHLPPGALELFTRRVQPILVNNCTTTGCHGENDENQFRLSRALLYGESNRKSTARNLRAVIAQLDRARVASSPLLQYANRKHGPMATAVFAQHRHDLFDQLVSWAQLVGEPQLAHAPQPAAAPPAAPVYDRRVVPASGNLPQRGAQRGPRIRFGAPLPPGALSRPTNPDAVSRAISSHNRSIPASPQEAKR